MIIKRDRYINFLKEFKDNEAIKIITGIRRSGKTFLMNMFIDELHKEGIEDDQIIHINFEDMAFSKLHNEWDLYNYVHRHENKTKKNYIFLDEIQNVQNWEKAVNSFRVDMNADIYVTGSNSHLLSGELATLLAGRYVELKVFPLSFKEYYDFKHGNPGNQYQLFTDYLIEGGFPAVDIAPNEDLKTALKKGIFDSVVLRDIALRAHTRDDQAIVAIIEYLMGELGSPVSATNISNTLRSNGFKTTTSTVISYLRLLTQSYLFYQAKKYDIRGKKMMSTLGKYYVADTGLRNTRLKRNYRDNLGHQIENIVFIELLRRGYSVDVGDYSGKEIDFVARRGNEIEYYQVTEHLPENNTRETDNLRYIPDGYKKCVLSLSQFDTGVVEGIPVKYLLDWLLKE
ncbi:ATP-binding protein [uncultured Lactobacillus sp.]|uniref:ATP-binding protein n=1 Tax=uncultured Lactobacillus sp. TaxID=153152 RepID=UPI00260BD5FB|nr:ATP-binding protein [uncultured Lactobacillus sp.]